MFDDLAVSFDGDYQSAIDMVVEDVALLAPTSSNRKTSRFSRNLSADSNFWLNIRQVIDNTV